MALVPIIFLALFFFLIIFCNSLFFKPKNKLLIFAVLFIILFLGLLGLTTYYSLIDLNKAKSYEELGPFGDYIGGVLNPVISTFAVFAAGFAFYAQYDANRQVRIQFKKQVKQQLEESRKEYFRSRSNLILNEINSFYYSFNDEIIPLKNQKLNYQGSQAILKLLENSKNTFYGQNKVKRPDLVEPKLKELESLLVFFKITIIEIKVDKVLLQNDKIEVAQFLKFIFESKLRNNFEKVERFKSIHNFSCPKNCGNFHGIPSHLFDLINEIKDNVDSLALSYTILED